MKAIALFAVLCASLFGAVDAPPPQATITVAGEIFLTHPVRPTRTIGGAVVRVYCYDLRSAVDSALKRMFGEATSPDQPKEMQIPTVMAASVRNGIARVVSELPKPDAQATTGADGSFSLKAKRSKLYCVVASQDKYVWVVASSDFPSPDKIILSNENLYQFRP